jgi:hypothetical protein
MALVPLRLATEIVHGRLGPVVALRPSPDARSGWQTRHNRPAPAGPSTDLRDVAQVDRIADRPHAKDDGANLFGRLKKACHFRSRNSRLPAAKVPARRLPIGGFAADA